MSEATAPAAQDCRRCQQEASPLLHEVVFKNPNSVSYFSTTASTSSPNLFWDQQSTKAEAQGFFKKYWLIGKFVERLSIWVCLVFSHDQTEVRHFWQKYRSDIFPQKWSCILSTILFESIKVTKGTHTHTHTLKQVIFYLYHITFTPSSHTQCFRSICEVGIKSLSIEGGKK